LPFFFNSPFFSKFFKLHITFNLIFSLPNRTALPALHLTWWRLCEGGGLTNVRAGYTLENQQKSVCGHTPPLSQSRSLHAGHSYFFPKLNEFLLIIFTVYFAIITKESHYELYALKYCNLLVTLLFLPYLLSNFRLKCLL